MLLYRLCVGNRCFLSISSIMTTGQEVNLNNIRLFEKAFNLIAFGQQNSIRVSCLNLLLGPYDNSHIR